MRRISSILLAMLMFATLFIAPLGSTALTSGNFVYEVKDGYAVITDYTGSGVNITIPAEIDGYDVIEIGKEAFYKCRNAISITLPEGLKRIGELAFWYCNKLTTINIPDSVQSIGYGAFYRCQVLSDVKISENNSNYCVEDGMIFNKDKTETIQFLIGSGIDEYKIPDSVKIIGDYSFADAYKLTSVEFNDSITHIGEMAFWGSGIQEAILPDSVVSIGDQSFDQSRIATLKIPDSITVIPAKAFHMCDKLTSVTFGKGLKEIGDYAFSSCTSLKSLSIPEGVTSLGEKAIAFCTSLTEISLPNTLEEIKKEALNGCMQLAEISIPESVIFIGDRALDGCSSLKSVSIPENVSFIGDCVFSNCTELEEINVAEENENYCDVDGVLFSKDMEHIKAYPNGKDEKTYSIPSGVKHIDYSVFAFCDLESVIMPDGLISVGEEAFRACENIKSLSFPSSVTTFGKNVVISCENLTELEILGKVTQMDFNAFASNTALEKVTIADGTTVIGDGAFYYCTSLNEITIPDSVTMIDKNAFDYCTNLSKIIIPDSVTEIKDYAFNMCENVTIYGYEGSYAQSYAAQNEIPFVVIEKPVSVQGDLDGDGEVTSYDALLTLKASVGIVELTPEQEKLADMNDDGEITSEDALTVLKMSVGII